MCSSRTPASGNSPPLGQITEAHLDKTFDTNVKGTVFTVQKALPLMSAGGSIVINASMVSIKNSLEASCGSVLSVGYSGSRITLPMELIREADRLGVHSAWTAEAYGSAAAAPAAWIAAHTKRLKVRTAIMQTPARTPAMTAMTATTLDQLSGGRFLLGLGLSGPQVAEGWHRVAYGKPLAHTREYVAIVRAVWAPCCEGGTAFTRARS